MPNRAMPIDTARIFERSGRDCTNLGLLLDKYQPWQERNGQWNLTSANSRGGQAKSQWLRDLQPSTRIDGEALEASHRRWEAMVKAQGGKPFSLETQWRMVVGLGGPSVLETAMTLHHICGFPIIPGSALKGLARARALLGVAEQLDVPVLSLKDFEEHEPDTPIAQLESFLVAQDGKERETTWCILKSNPLIADSPVSGAPMNVLTEFADKFRDIFGSVDRAGEVTFFDGVPGEVPSLTVDIMNSHYPDYYDKQKNKPPASTQDPNPVYFLTVARETRFFFAVAPRTPKGEELAPLAATWLRSGLKTMGVGAKTVAGYGYFG
jgi:CRISPR-associated protein Cmr6